MELILGGCAVLCFLFEDIAELDGGKAATVTFPEVNDLTVFNVKVRGFCVRHRHISKRSRLIGLVIGPDCRGHGSVERRVFRL